MPDRDRRRYVLDIPVRTYNRTNARGHWSQRHKRTRAEREATFYALKHARLGVLELPVRVTMVRHSPGKMDSDNVQAALKAVRDEIAVWIGVDDAHVSIEWVYDQVRAARGVHFVRITLEETDG